MEHILAPSILSADFLNLRSSIAMIEQNGGGWVHFDVMDGSFVPNISFGQSILSAIRPITKLPLDVHLMIEHPENHIESFAAAGADWITFHYENVVHHHRLIQQIHSLGKKAGICIVPSTPVSAIEELLPFVDLVLVMTVNPGFGGQELIPHCLKKLEQLKKIRQNSELSFILSVDGGVNNKTVSAVIDAGADVLVSGSSFFSGSLTLPL